MATFNHAINSAVATGIAEIITLPICTMKTVYQNTNSTSITQTIKHIFQTSGIKGFYKASAPAILSQMFSTSSKFALYKKMEDLQLPYTNKISNGVISGVVTTIFTHPLDVVKIHWQMNERLMNSLHTNGMQLFYRGYSKSLSKVALGSALFFPLTDYSKQLTCNNIILASFLSGFTSTLIVHPVDYLKTRHIYGLPLYQGINPKVYYKGLSLNLLRIVPHFILVMTGIEVIEKYRSQLV